MLNLSSIELGMTSYLIIVRNSYYIQLIIQLTTSIERLIIIKYYINLKEF